MPNAPLIVYHALTYIPITLMGAWYFARAGMSMGDIGSVERAAGDDPPPAPATT